MSEIHYRWSLLMYALLLLLGVDVKGQAIQGQIMDVTDNKPIDNVIISNVYHDVAVTSDRFGRFSIAVAGGELVEFRKDGYKVIRVRIPQGKLPFFNVALQKYDPAVPIFENMASPDYKSDSIKYAQLYKKELEFPIMTTIQVIQHPFSAMSKHNQQVWAFQKEYSWYQQQKYIDYTFSDKLITSITGLIGDSLRIYKRLFRPTYEQLRNMGEYNYLVYIKRTVDAYRHRGVRARSSQSRSTN
jgi:hypothetical protein